MDISTSHLAIVQQGHRAKGFSEIAADRMTKAQKPSGHQVYEGKWKIFINWCEKRDINPVNATSLEVADFSYTFIPKGN